MKTNVAYEVVDFRPEQPLTGIAAIDLTPGGDIRVDRTDGYGEVIPVPDDGFYDDEDTGIVEVMAPTGRIHLQRMSLAHLDHLVEKRFMPTLPRFTDEDAMHSYFLELVRENAHG